MRRTVQSWMNGRANALGSRMLCVLFAILALCATPLGTGELFAAGSHLHERQGGEIRDGDLPLPIALSTGLSQLVETVDGAGETALSSVLVDEPQDATPARASIDAGEIGDVAVAASLPGVRGGLSTGFNARAPPVT